jgi:hypothetical protein
VSGIPLAIALLGEDSVIGEALRRLMWEVSERPEIIAAFDQCAALPDAVAPGGGIEGLDTVAPPEGPAEPPPGPG